jgi:hypothetical protein
MFSALNQLCTATARGSKKHCTWPSSLKLRGLKDGKNKRPRFQHGKLPMPAACLPAGRAGRQACTVTVFRLRWRWVPVRQLADAQCWRRVTLPPHIAGLLVANLKKHLVQNWVD